MMSSSWFSARRGALWLFVFSLFAQPVAILAAPPLAIPTLPQVTEFPQLERVIVLFDQLPGTEHIDALSRAGARVGMGFQSIPGVAVEVPAQVVEILRTLPGVTAVVPDMKVSIALAQSVPLIGANVVQAAGGNGAGVKVCIIDTGVDDGHSALPSLVAEYDFVNKDTNAHDDHGHGTHVAGIVASQDAVNRGVAPGASLMAAKVLSADGGGYTSDVIAGVEWCVNQGAKVLNLSLGGGAFSGACDSDPLAQAVNVAVDRGAVVAAASGNNGSSSRISSPGCASRVITVGATNDYDQLASFSNGGTQLDVVAPGVGITSTKLGGGFVSYSGTSMATPHVAAAAALLLGANAGLNPTQVRGILQDTAVDLRTSGFDTATGYGRINALAAYTAVTGGGTEPPPPPPPPVTTVTLFSDDFSSGLGNWTTSSGVTWITRLAAEETSPNGGTVAHADDCDAGCTLTFKNALNLTTVQSPVLLFQRFVDSGLDSGEYLRLELYDGSSWRTIRTWTHRDGDDDRWNQEQIDLTPYRSANFLVRFVSRESSRLERTEVDLVVVQGVPL